MSAASARVRRHPCRLGDGSGKSLTQSSRNPSPAGHLQIGARLDPQRPDGVLAVAGLGADGLVERQDAIDGTLVPTLRGRLHADALVRALA